MRSKTKLIVPFKKLQLFVVLQLLTFLFAYTNSFGQQCNIGDLPSVRFSSTSVRILKKSDSILRFVAVQMRNNPTCNLKVTSYGSSSKIWQQRSWDYVNAVLNFLIEKEGISEQRFIFNYGQEGGDPTIVDLLATTEEGPASVPPPHPNLRKGR